MVEGEDVEPRMDAKEREGGGEEIGMRGQRVEGLKVESRRLMKKRLLRRQGPLSPKVRCLSCDLRSCFIFILYLDS